MSGRQKELIAVFLGGAALGAFAHYFGVGLISVMTP
jgi:hypothetical protein